MAMISESGVSKRNFGGRPPFNLISRSGFRPAVIRVVISALLGAILVTLIPGSPLSLARFWVIEPTIDGKSAARWAADLASVELPVKTKAMEALVRLSTRAYDQQNRIGEMLSPDQDEGVRILASLALAKMDPPPDRAITHLAKALKDPDLQVRANVARALFRLGPKAQSLEHELIEAIKDKENHNYSGFTSTIQEVLILALGKASADLTPDRAGSAIAVLTGLLENGESQEIKNAAIRSLGMMGPAGRLATPAIFKVAGQESWPYKEDAKTALAGMGLTQEQSEIPPQPSKDLVLPDKDRQYIWKMEHHGNVLGKAGFSHLCKALSENNESLLKGFFAPGFRGQINIQAKPLREERVGFWAERHLPDASVGKDCDRETFVAQLLAWRKPFGNSKPQAKIALVGISPVNKVERGDESRGDLDGPWEVKSQWRLHGNNDAQDQWETVANVRMVLERPTFERLSKGGWIREAEIQEITTCWSKGKLFHNVTLARGLQTDDLYDHWKGGRFESATGGIYVTDFNKDGWLDLLVTDLSGGELYQGGPGGNFTKVKEKFGLDAYLIDALVAAWVDIDQDGWDDLILGKRVLKNEKGTGFTDMTHLVRPKLPEDYINILVADYDRDGKPDLYFARTGKPGINSWLEGKSGDHRTNLLYRNLGNWKFRNETEKAGVAGDRFSTFSAVWFDANNDGWPDLHVPNEFGDGLLHINRGDGTFRAVRLGANPVDFGTMGIAAGDIDNDGQIDLYCANMYSKAGTRVLGNLPRGAYPESVMTKMRQFVAGSQLHLNRGDGTFVQAGKSMHVAGVGWAYGPVLADLDNDGWLDIYATAGYCSRDRNEPDG